MTISLVAELNKLNPCNEIAPAVVLDPDGWFRAIDQNNYDVQSDSEGFWTNSPEGYGRTPLDAIIDLLDNMADFERADAHIAKVNA